MSTEKREPYPESAPGDEVLGRITAILADLLEVDSNEIQSDTKLEEDLGADSLLYLELFEEMKDEFGLDIEMHQIQQYASKNRIATVGEIADMIRRYRTEGEAMLGKLTSESEG